MVTTENSRSSGADKPKVMLVRVNGEELFSTLETRLKDDFEISQIQEYDLLGSEEALRDAASLIYPYKPSSSRIEAGRFEALLNNYKTLPIFVVGNSEELKQVPSVNNVRKITLEQLESDRDKTLDGLVKHITDFSITTMPKGTVLLYDPKKELSAFTRQMKENQIWTERSETIEDFCNDLAFHRNVVDAIIIDYQKKDDGQSLVTRVREVRPDVPVIAIVRKTQVDACKADYPVVKAEKIPFPLVLHHLRRELSKPHDTKLHHVESSEIKHSTERLFYIMGPSAAGKTTATNLAASLLGSRVAFIKKYTTRPMRPQETEDVDYQHQPVKDNAQFEYLKSKGNFLHTFEYKGYQYGVPRLNTLDALNNGKHLLMVNPAIEQFEAFHDLFSEHGTVPIMLFADPVTLKDRMEERGFSSSKERDERLSAASDQEKEYDQKHEKFLYRLYTDRGMAPLDTARRLVSIINWEEQQQLHPSQRTFDETHKAYVNEVLRVLFRQDADELLERKPIVDLKFSRDAIEDYCAKTNYSGIVDIIKKFTPLPVIAVTNSYGHLGIFFDGHGKKEAKLDTSSRSILMELIEHQLAFNGLVPKSKGRNIGQVEMSHLSFAITPKNKRIIDGVMYALTDEYMLRDRDSTPHAVSFGYISSKSGHSRPVPMDKPRPATQEEIREHFLLDTRRGNNPYDNEIKRAVLRRMSYNP